MAHKNLVMACMLAILVRVVIFLFIAANPIPDERQNLTSPSVYQKGGDIECYLMSRDLYASGSFYEVIKNVTQKIDGGDYVSPPVFPLLIHFFNYTEGNTYPLALFYLLMSCCLVCLWLYYLYKQKIPFAWLVLFALIPNPVWYTIQLTTDLLCSLFFAVFFLFYFKDKWNKYDISIWILMLILLFLTRPNAIAFVVFVLADLVLIRKYDYRYKIVMILISLIPLALFSRFLFNYGIALAQNFYDTKTGGYFGITVREYVHGIYGSLPQFLNYFFSWITLLLAKILYFVGLRPSYTNTVSMMALARGGIGIILLPGLIYALFKAKMKYRILILLFMIPILPGPTQERLNLPIQPLMFYFGVIAIRGFLEKILPTKLVRYKSRM